MMYIEDIKDYLPQRYPFLLVDRVLEIELGKRIKAYKNVTTNEEFFQGHFPQKPIMPGVLIIEAMAQAAGVRAAARERLEEFDSLLALDIRQRQLEIDSGRAAIAAAEDGARAATEARRVVMERYDAGVATQTEVLDAEFALLQAELDRTRAMAGVRFSEARLARALGQ